LPRGSKKDVVAKVIVSEIGKNKGDKYEISVAMEITGGKVLAAKDECSNVFAGVDLVEAKLTGQIRRFKLEVQPHRQKRSLKNLFIKRS
jgi:ribosome-associated translation inhibitor RaiA